MSLAVRVIPCLDVADGRVVKGVNFANLQDSGDPVERATRYYEQGADELTFLDVMATLENRSTMYDIVERTAETLFIPLTVGGGIRTTDDVARLLEHGADKVSVASAAISRPALVDEIAERFGAQVLVISLDVARSPSSASGWIVTSHGGREHTDIDALQWAAEAAERGAGELLVNSIGRGRDSGRVRPRVDRRCAVGSRCPGDCVGWCWTPIRFFTRDSRGGRCSSCGVFHSEQITIPEVKDALRNDGWEVRL